MSYKDFLKENYSKVRGDEAVMWKSVESVSELIEKMKDAHPQMYWSFMREQHEIVRGKHFDEAYAKYEVSQMCHKGADGKMYRGEHWSVEETNSVLSQYRSSVPSQYNEYDFYVALNAQYHDYCAWVKKHIPDKDETEVIVSSAIAFWFNDEDWGNTSKVWDYFAMKPQKKEER